MCQGATWLLQVWIIYIKLSFEHKANLISRLLEHLHVHSGHYRFLLTLNVRGPSYLGLTRSISWLLMPWLLTSPGHQQPWYWLYRMCRSMWRNDIKYKYTFMFPLKNLARKGLILVVYTEFTAFRWLCARLWYLQCISNGDTPVLY